MTVKKELLVAEHCFSNALLLKPAPLAPWFAFQLL